MHGRLCGCKMGQKRLISEEQVAKIRKREDVKKEDTLADLKAATTIAGLRTALVAIFEKK